MGNKYEETIQMLAERPQEMSQMKSSRQMTNSDIHFMYSILAVCFQHQIIFTREQSFQEPLGIANVPLSSPPSFFFFLPGNLPYCA